MPQIVAGSSMDSLAGLLTEAPKEKKDPAATAADESTIKPAAASTSEGDDGTPPIDGTDDDTGGDDTGSDDSRAIEGDDDAPSTEPLYTVKIDGKEEQVSLKEALAGYQRNADYTRKTMEVATARQAAEATHAEARTQRDNYAATLKIINDRLGPASGEPTEEQWNTLRTSDPAAYATEYADFQRRTTQRAAVKAEQDRIANEQATENTNRAKVYVEGERTKLMAALPILADPVKGPKEMEGLREYAKTAYGFSDQELNQAYDHRMILMVNHAKQWDAHVKALAAAKAKLADAPTAPEPGSRTPPKPAKAAAREAAQKRFDKSGRVDDAVDLMFTK